MNYYAASVALLWTTAMRGAALATAARNRTPSGRHILPLAKSRFAWAMRSGVSMTKGAANRIGPSAATQTRPVSPRCQRPVQ